MCTIYYYFLIRRKYPKDIIRTGFRFPYMAFLASDHVVETIEASVDRLILYNGER